MKKSTAASVEVQIVDHGRWLALQRSGQLVRTPMGTPLVTQHEPLAERMAVDVAAWGADPTRKTTCLALQCAYLDFGLQVPRADLEVPVLSCWPADLFVNRPQSPELMMPLLSLWGPEPLGDQEFVRRVRALPLRQLMVLMQCGAQFQSAVLGLQLLESDRAAAPLAMGACARYWAHLNDELTFEKGHLRLGRSDSGRHDPNDTDDAYCRAACCADGATAKDHGTRCPMTQVLEAMRAWAAFPEEEA